MSVRSKGIGAAAEALLLCGVLGAAALSTGGCAGPGARAPAVAVANGETEALGIERVELRRSAAGYMLDLRYRVADPEKAAPLLDGRIRPYLLDEASGARLFVPAANMGPLRQTGGKAATGRTYFALFANPGRHVKPGSRVTLVLGERRLAGLTVLE